MRHSVERARKILLIDASRDEREMYAEWFRRQGCCTLQAASAADGYRIAVELRPDVVITDVKLSGSTDGLTLTTRLKHTPETHGVPVVVLSGYVLEADSDNARRVGCDLFICKPCLPEQLSLAVEELLAAKS
jgi:CheY-like chemotaxis protein